MSQENIKSRGDWDIFLDDFKSEIVAWHFTWLQCIMYGVNNDHILLVGFHGNEGYSTVHVVHQFGWIQRIPLAVGFPRFTLIKS